MIWNSHYKKYFNQTDCSLKKSNKKRLLENYKSKKQIDLGTEIGTVILLKFQA
jgi:hypothetical protein